jgi:hypothetical protein
VPSSTVTFKSLLNILYWLWSRVAENTHSNLRHVHSRAFSSSSSLFHQPPNCSCHRVLLPGLFLVLASGWSLCVIYTHLVSISTLLLSSIYLVNTKYFLSNIYNYLKLYFIPIKLQMLLFTCFCQPPLEFRNSLEVETCLACSFLYL